MPCAFRIYPQRRLVHSISYGVITGDELREHAAALRSDPGFSPDFAQLADWRPSTRVDISPDDVRRHVPSNPFGPSARRAVIASDDLAFALSRMFSSLSDGTRGEMHVTRDIEEAWRWLRVPPDAPEREAVEATFREYAARAAQG